ncbi:hypothetical protein L208DRAFT_932081 [Tricholoma matsutake]|nr:hypothetical protein L208DRAFT_932081 [Tricholoma matsutake 945]
MSPTLSSVFSSASSPYSTQISHSTIDNRTTILTVVLVSVGILLFAGAIFLTIWLRKRRFSHDSRSSDPFSSTTNLTLKLSASHGTQITDPFHLAARITPFGSPGGETPRFKRSSSSPMRIANRLPSGAWHFADPRDPFAPAGVTDIDVLPSQPSSPTISAMATPYSRSRSRKEREANALISTRDKTEAVYPPPAYSVTGNSLLKEQEPGHGPG